MKTPEATSLGAFVPSVCDLAADTSETPLDATDSAKASTSSLNPKPGF
ncbi:hypothetical protein X752_13420 [Mesorhizobium sp. LNJC398B00]|nr:hypothetical protein X752_13420 [Mesorhizobium sp. LNJC398B00]